MNNFNILNGILNKKFEFDTGNTLTIGLQHFWKMNDHIDFWGNNNLNYYIKGMNSAGNAAQYRDQTNYNRHNINGKRDLCCYFSGKTTGGAWTENQISSTVMGNSGSLSYWSYFILNATHFDGEPSIYTTNYPNNQGCLNLQGGSGNDGLYFKLYQDSSFTIGTTKPALGTWNHWVVTWSGTNRKIYCNGNLDISATKNQNGWKTGKLYIGTHFQNRDQIINGYMCNIGLWNKSLTLSEVLSLYNSGNGNTIIYG